MSYESDCNDYAVHGNPFQDAMDYEENSRYDQYDGQRGDNLCLAGHGDFEEDSGCDECGYRVDFEEDPGCDECGYRGDCADCEKAKADSAEIDFRRESADYEDCEVPF